MSNLAPLTFSDYLVRVPNSQELRQLPPETRPMEYPSGREVPVKDLSSASKTSPRKICSCLEERNEIEALKQRLAEEQFVNWFLKVQFYTEHWALSSSREEQYKLVHELELAKHNLQEIYLKYQQCKEELNQVKMEQQLNQTGFSKKERDVEKPRPTQTVPSYPKYQLFH